jgi:hypothetical protein
VRRAAVVLLVTARTAFAQAPEAEQRAAAEHACAAHDATCDWVRTYSPLEQATLGRALAARGYEVEPSPWGKVIDRIHVYNEDVFAEDNWLRFFNYFHWTTREHSIVDELTIGEGELWDQARVEESMRRLRDPLYSTVIAFVPVKSQKPGRVDLFVVTRDVWSLRLNTNYTYQESSLTYLSISLSENNFLGHRNLVAAALLMDQGSVAVGPLFIDKNLLGSHLSLSVRIDDIFTRRKLKSDPLADPTVMPPTCNPTDPNFPCSIGEPAGVPHGIEDHGGFHSEGTDSSISLSQPLWALASEWGWGASFSHRFAPVRQYLGTGIYAYSDATTGNLLPREYYNKRWSASASVIRQWGTEFKYQLQFGHTVTSQRPTFLDTFPSTDPGERADFQRDVFPRSEVLSTPFVSFGFFQPRYRVSRNISTYELAEDFQIGPSLSATFAVGLAALGSSATAPDGTSHGENFESPSLSVGWTFPWCRDGYITPSAGVAYRFQNTTLNDGTPTTSIDNTASASLYVITPSYKFLRVVAQAAISTRWHDTQNAFLAIGSDSGLRGFEINQFIGQRRVSGIAEARTTSFRLWLLRFGGVAFYEIGSAAETFNTMRVHQDIGVGLRMLIPQTSRELWRFDLAFPLDATPSSPAFQPHFIAGFQSYF